MESINLLSCPEEIVNHIAKFMSPGEILDCSQTCRYLRNSLNNDSVWRNYLVPNAVWLETEQQLVQKALQNNHTLTLDSLPPLCRNRLMYMQKVQVLNNVRSGENVQYSVDLNCQPKDIQDTSRSGTVFLDKYVILNHNLRSNTQSWFLHRKIKVWDVSKEPKVYCVLKLNAINYGNAGIIQTSLVAFYSQRLNEESGNKLCRIDVYKITLPEKDFPLQYSFSVHDEVVKHNGYVSCSESPICNETCGKLGHRLVGQYLVTHYRNLGSDFVESKIFHVWDIAKGLKVGTFVFPYNIHKCISFHSCTNNNWYVTGDNRNNDFIYFCKFNIEKKMYSKSVFMCPKHEGLDVKDVRVYKDCALVYSVVSEYQIKFTLYNFRTSKKKKERHFRVDSEVNHVYIDMGTDNGKLLVNSLDGVRIVDVLTLRNVERFDLYQALFTDLPTFNLFGSPFALIDDDLSDARLWDIQKKKETSTKLVLNPNRKLYFNSHTKIIICDHLKMTVFHFW